MWTITSDRPSPKDCQKLNPQNSTIWSFTLYICTRRLVICIRIHTCKVFWWIQISSEDPACSIKTTLTYNIPHVHTCAGEGLPWLPLRLSQNHPGNECASACTTFQHATNMNAHFAGCQKGRVLLGPLWGKLLDNWVGGKRTTLCRVCGVNVKRYCSYLSFFYVIWILPQSGPKKLSLRSRTSQVHDT